MNNQIAQNKAAFNKTKAVSNVDFWEQKFRDHKKTLEQILEDLRVKR